jgi:murein DD-endopeptidase MepM/ murein hydrolase activator NlpD
MQQADRTRILAQKLARLIAGSRLVRVGVALVLPFLGVVAAFGIAPDTVTEPVARRHVVQELDLRAALDTAEDKEGYWREERIRRGDSLATLLERLGVNDPAAFRSLRGLRSARALHNLVPGRTIHARATSDGYLLELRYQVGGNVFRAQRRDDVIHVSEQPAEFERRVVMASTQVETSLFAATDAAGLPDAIAVQLADIFSTDIDFHRDLRRGDHFSVVYEMYYDRSEPARAGRVLAAEFINVGKLYRAIYYQQEGKPGGYYTPDGRNIRKAFLRSPIELSRITSGFSNSRFHPILRTWRAHRGIDYAAPTGTRVKATGDGVVEFAGRDSSYGNLVVLRHQSKTTTWYGHLSRLGEGIRRGARVSQSQVVGYVGSTGLATGPHLHYEFRIGDVHQNPLRVVVPAGPPIGPESLPAFEAATRPLVQSLQLLRSTNLVRLD